MRCRPIIPRKKHALPVLIACLVVLLLLTVRAAFAQPEVPHMDDLTVRVTAKNTIVVEFRALYPTGHQESLKKALLETFHGELTDVQSYMDGDENGSELVAPALVFYAKWDALALQKGLRRDTELDLTPLRKAIRQCGVKLLNVNISLPNYGAPYWEGAAEFPGTRYEATYWQIVRLDRVSGPILRFGYGYTAEDVQRTVGSILIVLLIPILLTFALRYRALRAHNADPTAVWFGYQQAQGWIETAFWYIWVGFLFSSQASYMLSYALSIPRIGVASPTWIFLLFVPRSLVTVINAALSQPVYARIRGIELSTGSLAQQAAWTTANNYLPLNFMIYGYFSLTVGMQYAVFWFAASFLTRNVCASRLAKLMDAKPFLLTSGELRDYVFGMAQFARVKLQNLILLPTARMQEANAAASINNDILVTDYLLQNMTRREVNAVMAHEMTHLQRGHANTHRIVRGALFYGPIITLSVIQAVVTSPVAHWFIWYPLVALSGMPVYLWLSRRHEKEADLGACALTGDPEAMLSGLFRLSKLSMMPQDWGRVSHGLSSHPSNMRRARYIADAYRIPQSRIDELLLHPLTGDYYPVPKEEIDETRIYSPAWRQKNAIRNLIAYVAVMLVPLLLIAHGAQRVAIPEAMLWPAYIMGIVISGGLMLLVSRWMALHGYGELRARMRHKFEAQLRPNLETLFTGFAPGGLPKSYGGNRDWDLGFLQVGPNAIHYIGEQTQFTLRRENIVEIQLVEAKANWYVIPRLAIAWRDAAQYQSGVFNILPCETDSAARTRKGVVALAQQLEAWRLKPNADTPAEGEPSFGLPFSKEVTGRDFKTLGTFATLFATLRITLIVAFGAAALTGLSFRPSGDTPSGGWYVLIGMALVTVFAWIPQARYREPAFPQTPPVPPRPPEPVVQTAPARPAVPPLPVAVSDFDLSQ